MDAERSQQIWNIFEAALAKDAEEREGFLDQVCADDTDLRRELVALLEADERASLLDADADALVTPLADALHASSSYDGQIIAQYQILGQLGRGGMGIVYKARDTRLKRAVALKFLPPYLSHNTEAKERLLVEAQAAAALEHPNLCTIHEIGEAGDGRLFIVMPYYEGETLKDKIARGPLPVAEALAYAVQMARGLEQAHRQGVVHRDVKPANVMVVGEGIVKVMDFGLAKVTDVSLTRPGTKMGTVAYMSPEQAQGQGVDARTDQWSLGVVLYEMLTGARPFSGEYEQAVLYAILHEAPEPLRVVRPDVPQGLAPVIMKVLDKQPQRRYGTMQDVIRALQTVEAAGTAEGAKTRAGSVARDDAAGEETRSTPAERVQATIVVTRLIGYVDLVELLPPDEVNRLVGRIQEAAGEIVRRHEGVINGFTDEEVVVIFGLPAPHEDDFVRAVRVARELHARVREVSAEVERLTGRAVRLQTGLDTGSVVARRSGRAGQAYRVTGHPLQVATQLALHAEPDEILVSPTIRRLIDPYFETEAEVALRLRGERHAVTPYRVLEASGIQTRLEAAERAGLTAFTGRQKEVQTVERCLEGALRGEGQFVTVVGEAGLGKSRLLYEFRQGLSEADVTLIEGRCQSYGGSVPYLPFIEAVRHHLRVDGKDQPANPEETVAARLRAVDPSLEAFIPLYLHLLSIPSEVYPLPEHLEGENLRLAMLEGLAALVTLSTEQRPVVMLLEDWHWSDKASREVLVQLAEMAPAYRLLLVMTSRPVYAGEWDYPVPHTPIHLRPLTAASSIAMLEAIFSVEQVPEMLGRLLYERTGGNPFFLEEICQTLREEGAVRVDSGRLAVTRSLDRFHLPDTIEAVIRTRLHRLDRSAQSVLRLASVVGREFSRGIIQYVFSDDASLLPALEALRAAGLIRQTRVLPEAAYRFKHALTQEVAYGSLLQHQRKVLHGQVAEAIEALYSDRIEEQSDLLAHHFSQAETWRRAAHYGRMAAERFHGLSQFAEALGMLEKTQAWLMRLPVDTEQRETLVEIILHQERLCETQGKREHQQQLIDDLLSLLDPPRDQTRLAEVYVRQGDLDTFLGRFEEAEAALTEALRLSRALSDVLAERKALQSMGFLRSRQDRFEEAVAINEEILAIDRRRGDTEALAADLTNLLTALQRLGDYDRGMANIEEALGLCHTLQNPVTHISLFHNIGTIYRGLGDYERARTFVEQCLEIGTRLQLPINIHYSLSNLAHLDLEQGDIHACVARYKEAAEVARRARFVPGLSASLRRLGEVLLALERHAEALPYLLEAADVFAQLQELDHEAQIWSLAATAYERQGAPPEALAAWQKAHRLQKQTGHTLGVLEALEGMARSVRVQGGIPRAVTLYSEALALAEHLGDLARQGDLNNTLGILAWKQGRYDEALSHYQAALALFRERDDLVHAGLMLNSIGVTLKQLGRHEEAISCLEEAVVLHRRTAQKLLEAHAAAALGDVYFEMKWYREALPYYGASMQLRWDLGDRKGEGWMLQRLARVYAAQGETGRARDSTTQAVKIAEEIGDMELLAACGSLRS